MVFIKYQQIFQIITNALAMIYALVSVFMNDRLKASNKTSKEKTSITFGFIAAFLFAGAVVVNLLLVFVFRNRQRLWTIIELTIVLCGIVSFIISCSTCWVLVDPPYYCWLLAGMCVAVESALFSLLMFLIN
ncbi:hypothetical protein EG68_03814 [Paragonimus skrjabini miyazakii]|uniref:Uncharacterized protein n=1 Tax=Paragonimus skrjabini miyazakii TaxID=59628 RepID=A0A8S9YW07_9TREM|nr:hypothetical protein EG68_03814 [Paragonimus skrjabini miyazakii]